MNALKLKNNIEISAKQVASVATVHTASAVRIVDLNIDLLGDTEGKADIIYELGTKAAGSFVPLPIEDSTRLVEISISGEMFTQVAHTPVSPSEKAMTPYNIIRTRLEAMMAASNLIEREA